MFVEELKNNIDRANSLQMTENGALGFKSTSSSLVDMNFKTASYRKKSEWEIIEDFDKAYSESKELTILWMFFARDVRGGLGERRLFRVLFRRLAIIDPVTAEKLLPLIPEYGRWDDLVYSTIDSELWESAVKVIREQWNADSWICMFKEVDADKVYKDSGIKNAIESAQVSLMAKWLPSERASSKETRRAARILAKSLRIDIKTYNRVLSELRRYLKVVETQMSAKRWEDINYSAVPSKANLKYKNAFLKNDPERRKQYLDSLAKGETKINAGVLFPHDIVHSYVDGWYSCKLKEHDAATEELWKALPKTEGLENTIVVADGSGSMTTTVDNSSRVTALDVANGLAIYCAQYCKGDYKDKYITFSARPQFVDLSTADSLHDKLKLAFSYSEITNTNIEAVFNIILKTAVNTRAKQEEIPEKVLIISDMEFDAATRGFMSDTLFDNIEREFKANGYAVPKLVFWNVASRTNTIPVTQSESGVNLVSGFSVNVLKMVQNGRLDPYTNLVCTLQSERYKPISEALQRY